MALSLIEKMKAKIVAWLLKEPESQQFPMVDFGRMCYELKPCDILLVEGRSRISEVIKVITQSPWSHAMIYLGRLHEIENPVLRERIRQFYQPEFGEQLVIESMLGKGTIVVPLSHYKGSHIRICRPKGISRQDAQQVIGFAIGRLGVEYGIRHNLDLARFLFPWSILPRRWRSTLFVHNIGTPTKEICSSMLAEAFASVRFPILPFVKSNKKEGVRLYQRNPKLFTPSDFDYSPYFEIIKYPIFELSQPALYRKLPWQEQGFISDHEEAEVAEEESVETEKAPETEPETTAEPTAEQEEKPAE